MPRSRDATAPPNAVQENRRLDIRMFDSGGSPYHGVLADDSRGVPVVDVNSSRVVVLFRRSYGHIWTETKQRTKSVPVKSLNGRMCLWMHTTAFINLFTFRWPVPVTVSLNRQLSVVSGRKNLCNLWESGNRTIKCWRGHWNNVSLSHFHSKPIYKLSFYKPKHFHDMWSRKGQTGMALFTLNTTQ